MQDIGDPDDESCTFLGHRRGIPDLARFALDLTWAGADSESAARSGSYPSPPMSGSPPLPPKASQEAAERIQGTYQATTQDVYRGSITTQGEERTQTAVPAPPRLSPSDAPERGPYGFQQRFEGPMARPLPYPQQLAAVGSQPTYRPVHRGASTTPLPAPQPYPAPAHRQGPEPFRQPSPNPKRKTKGHVASACVPCKKAHLRCDAQRPCSRCMSNGKEDACIDVQHKKRGRPRLRDDRETKFDNGRYGNAADPLRRPVPASLYGPGSSMGMAYDDNLRRTQSYRVLKSQPAESIAPRFPERALPSDANIFPAPLLIPPRAPELRAPEPAAFLTVDLEFGNASTTFLDAIARQSIKGVRLADLLVPGDRDKVSALQQQIQDERQRKDPTYLPPMFGRENAVMVMQRLGFSPEELPRYAPEWKEHLSFVGQDGQTRQLSLRMGLAKVDSNYIVVLRLDPVRAFQYPTPSPNPREITYSYQPTQQPYSQPTPVSATFDPRHSRPGDGGYGARQGAPPPPMMSGLSPGLQSAYSASPNRPEYSAGPSYQTPRGDLTPGARALQPPGYQLPPIRNQQPGASQQAEQPYHPREERSRVDIVGLLDRPGPSNKSQQ